ncbi:unknown [synthetic Vaccinia virus]|nr:unknown [synthetic Vaccinia virus]
MCIIPRASRRGRGTRNYCYFIIIVFHIILDLILILSIRFFASSFISRYTTEFHKKRRE